MPQKRKTKKKKESKPPSQNEVAVEDDLPSPDASMEMVK